MDVDSFYIIYWLMDNLLVFNVCVSFRFLLDFEYVIFFFFNVNENCVVIINEVWYLIKFELKLRENEVENCNCLCDLLYILNGCLKLLGYDFSKYVIDVDIFLWFL